MNDREQSSYNAQMNECQRGIDGIFTKLMVFQFIALIGTALWLSPLTWVGQDAAPHTHVLVAVFLGGAITLGPALLGWLRPGQAITRYVFSASQMLVSALLIHLLGGRIEAHFHIFGSLAFVTAYRDLRTILLATVVVAVEHLGRAVFLPFSVFGTTDPSFWRAIEHAGWVVFEDIVLICVTLQNQSMLRRVAKTTVAAQEKADQLRQDVKRLSSNVRRAADGDLTVVVNDDLNVEELCELESTFGIMVQELSTMVAEIRSESDIVRSKSAEASQVSVRMAHQMDQQMSAVEQIKAAAEELNVSIDGVRDNASRLRNVADEAGDLATRGEDAMRQSNASIEEMEKDANRIQSGIEEIKDIADQTSLLALNATIEAARAGEAGRGFAVVADEVKQLSHRCTLSASKIEELLSASSQSILQGAQHSRVTAEQLSRIIVGIQAVRDEVAQLVAIAESQNRVADEVRDATGSVALATEDSVRGSGEITERCESLNGLSERLSSKVARFKIAGCA